MIRRVAVLGLGLIGGSLARRLASGCDVVGYDSDPATREAAATGGLTVSASLAAAVADRDLVVLATPLPAFVSVLGEIATAGTAAILTDVASVKSPVLDAVRAALGGVRYVGGHPMAGTERAGFGASDPRLFDGAAWVLCVEDDTDLDAWLALTALVTGLGCRVVPCAAAEHDAAVARVSGLPHLLAAALAVVGAEGGPLALGLAAGSFRDATRVAGTSPELIAALCDGNRSALAGAVDAAVSRLAAAAEALRAGGTVAQLATAGHAARRQWIALSLGGDRSSVRTTDPGLRAALLALGAAGGHVTAVAGETLECWSPTRGGTPRDGPGSSGSAAGTSGA